MPHSDMMLTSYDFAFYMVLLSLVAAYFLTFRPVYIGGISSFFFFRNASVIYFSIFAILLGKFVYEGSTLISAGFNLHLYYLMFYYAIVLLLVATIFNLSGQPSREISKIPLNILPLVLALLLKVSLLAIDLTPMQELLANGIVEGHLKQLEWHQPGQGGVVKFLYVYFGAALSILFIVYFRRTRSRVFKFVLFLLMVETSGFYLSKSGMIVPLLVLLALSGMRLRYLAVVGLAGIFAVFYIRMGLTDLDAGQFVAAIGDRFILETGYSNTQLELYKSEHPPLGYESRYFIGLNSLFGIQPAIDASREAYVLENGRYGATTSGHAAVSLYAFWGAGFYVVAPILLCFIFYVDKVVVRRLSTDYALIAYLFIGFKAVNFLTVDVQRLVSFQTVVDLTFMVTIAVVLGFGAIIKLGLFSKPITIVGTRRQLHA